MPSPLEDLIDARISRRRLLAGAAKGAGVFAFSALLPKLAYAVNQLPQSSLFRPLPLEITDNLRVAEGHRADVLLAWGDPIRRTAPDFHPPSQSPESQELQFGYNNDFIAYMPLAGASDHGLLCVNHEYTTASRMFPDYSGVKTREQAAIELSAHGHSVVEIKRDAKGKWAPVVESAYNRRLSARTSYFTLTGPAAGSPRMRTKQDSSGTTVLGTLGNCAGGKTPWGTVLVAEENFNVYFSGTAAGTTEYDNHRRYGVNGNGYGWEKFYPRFNVNVENNEPNRFGWVVEYDPYNPAQPPAKRTALGRFKHESATVTLSPEGHVVVYSGDDEAFQCLYRFVSRGTWREGGGKANQHLLDDGILYVAKFTELSLTWIPLVHGEGLLTARQGFSSQADVLIETRRAAETVGATPMDRPEDIEVHPVTGAVYVSLTNNNERKETDKANPRAKNRNGHIIELQPPMRGGKPDHAAEQFSWDIFLLAGNPENKDDAAWYQGKAVEQQYLSCPDNLAIDNSGRLWVATDGQPHVIRACDSLYMVPTVGEMRGVPRRFLNAPRGAEVTGPEFTPDNTTLFVSIQHPGDEGASSYDNPTTRWPAAAGSALPPRPAVVAVCRDDKGVVGGAA